MRTQKKEGRYFFLSPSDPWEYRSLDVPWELPVTRASVQPGHCATPLFPSALSSSLLALISHDSFTLFRSIYSSPSGPSGRRRWKVTGRRGSACLKGYLFLGTRINPIERTRFRTLRIHSHHSIDAAFFFALSISASVSARGPATAILGSSAGHVTSPPELRRLAHIPTGIAADLKVSLCDAREKQGAPAPVRLDCC